MEPREIEGTLLVNPRQVKRASSGQPLAPARPEGVSQGQALREWGVTEHKLYVLEQLGRLFAIRFRNKVLYSREQLLAVLGDPSNPDGPTPRRRHNSSGDVSGEQLSWPEIGNAAAAA